MYAPDASAGEVVDRHAGGPADPSEPSGPPPPDGGELIIPDYDEPTTAPPAEPGVPPPTELELGSAGGFSDFNPVGVKPALLIVSISLPPPPPPPLPVRLPPAVPFLLYRPPRI
eukprot:SAG22_NODE_767_length_7375_cov_24.094055_2_plen_114_part_00